MGSASSMQRYSSIALRWRGTYEIALVAMACITYLVLCAMAPVRPALAKANGWAIYHLQRAYGWTYEIDLNRWLMRQSEMLADIVTLFYTISFFVGTVAALVVLWHRNANHYALSRNALFVMTGGAAITYWAFPVAPPRLLDGSPFVDTVAHANSGGTVYASFMSDFANAYGAMPSMHTGWSLWVALSLGAFVYRRWWQRIILSLYPIFTVLAIMATANHYILDAIFGALYCLIGFGVAILIARYVRPLPRRRSLRQTSH